VPFTVVHAKKYRTKQQIKNTFENLRKLHTAQKKQTAQNTAKQKYHGSVVFYDTRPGNEVNLFYNTSE